ncbi:MAG: hypothetical protein Ct9H90mP4_08850 [Gammaproteobacteria bacterium]|nr:MAG: hypothetical protein Ct9H90mP4_08850 [Gammaproteobacteria bacterium]
MIKELKHPYIFAFSKEVENTSGEYFVDCKTAPTTPGAKNMEDADKLWEISKNLCNLN